MSNAEVVNKDYDVAQRGMIYVIFMQNADGQLPISTEHFPHHRFKRNLPNYTCFIEKDLCTKGNTVLFIFRIMNELSIGSYSPS